MTRSLLLAAALVAVVSAGPALAQYDLPGARPATAPPDPKPVHKYELKPEHGEYVIFVRAFQGAEESDKSGQARDLAEGLAEWIRSECRLYAYVHARGWFLRRERDKEVAEVIATIRKICTANGESEQQIRSRIRREVKIARISDEYVVFVAPGKGALKTFEEAADFAKYVHKLPCPPGDFCDSLFVGSERDAARKQGERFNPFEKAMPGRNATLPKKEVTAATRPKADDFLMSINAGEKYSLIHKTKKDFTLVVQSYGSKQGAGQLVKPGEVVQTSGRSGGEMLERAAEQARSLVEVLRGQTIKEGGPFDAYVLHTRFESFVCIGEYDTRDDGRLLALQRSMAGLQLKDGKTMRVFETLMEKPLPAMIPRP